MSDSKKTHLAAAVGRLAASPDPQIEYLRELGVAPSADELVLEFEDALAGAELPPDAEQAAQGLLRWLDAMSGSGHEELWTFSALKTASEWQVVRRRARLLLAMLPDQP